MSRFAPALLLLVSVGCVPVLNTPGGEAPVDTAPWQAPSNRWPVGGGPPDGLVGEGWLEGQVIPEVILGDQYGDTVNLWQFYGMVVVVDVSTIWCAPCQKLAEDVQEVTDEFEGEGFAYVTLLSQDLSGKVPDTAELAKWGTDYNFEAPILADDQGHSAAITPGGVFPQVVIVGRDMKVKNAAVSPTTTENIRAGIIDAL